MEPAYIVLVVVGVTLLAAEVVVRRHLGQPVDLRQTGISVRVGAIAYSIGGVSQFAVKGFSFWAVSQFVSWRLPLWNPLTWIAYILLDDFVGYWVHRISHRHRVLWAAHSVHHSATDFTMANAARISPVETLYQPFTNLWAPLLGFPIALYAPITVVYLLWSQFQHTRIVGRLPWLDRWLTTPSNHRVHHGKNTIYLDRNYGLWTMIWDRLLGTYTPETEPVEFGITDPPERSGVVATMLGGYPRLARDVRATGRPSAGLRVAWAPPTSSGQPERSSSIVTHVRPYCLRRRTDHLAYSTNSDPDSATTSPASSRSSSSSQASNP